jgi:uncharacterized membrane protein
MPFCSKCGNAVGVSDAFCARCGVRQPVPPGSAPGAIHPVDPLASITGRTASILCYVPGIGWIVSIIALAADKFRHDRTVRFHAFQGLYLFVAWLLADWVLRPMSDAFLVPHFHLGLYRIIQAGLLGMSIFMMIKASHDQAFPLPLFGELAQRSMAENQNR